MADASSNISTATEHTEPISTATEHTEPILLDYNDVLDTADLDMQIGPPCRRVLNAATEHIRIGPCILHWSRVSNLELGVLCNLHHEIQDRIRMPVSFDRLFVAATKSCCQDDGIVTQSRSSSGCVEAIARCVAAFQNATDAAEHSQCNEIATKLCSYATALAQKTSPYIRKHFLALVYEYIQNRTYDLALKKMVNRAFESIGDGFWSCVGAGRQRSECLTLLGICTNAVTDHGQALRDEMASLR